MRGSGALAGRSAVCALALAALVAPAAAQDTFSLPPGTPSPTARPAGPVDPDNPVVTPRPRPTQTASPQPATPQATATASPAPRIAAPPAAEARPTPRPTATPRAPSAPQGTGTPSAAATAPQTAPATDPLALPVPTASAPVGDTFPTAIPTALPGGPGSSDASAAAALPDWWPLALGGLAALLALFGGLVWWRKRRGADHPAIAFEPPVVEAAPPAPAPAPAPKPVPATESLSPPPAPAPAPQPEAAPAAAGVAGDGLAITLEARRLDASLMATTLAYTLRLTNHGQTPLTGLAVEADMVAAHASLPVEKQIASTEQRLERRHALAELGPGESADFRGEMRLPLAAITPIRAGDATYFVPLARLRIEAAPSADEQVVLAQTFVIGELPEQAGGALRPFRLDLGPRTFSRLGQRAVG